MKNHYWETAIVAAGLAVLGFFVYLGLGSLAERDRVVSVRGLAEREVKADRVIWPIVYKTTGNDLQALYARLNDVGETITQFLVANQVPDSAISLSAPQIVDLRADRYNTNRTADRYNVTLVTTVTTDKVDLVRSLMPRMGELLKSGIAISVGDYDSQVRYEFNGLNRIKPEMIAVVDVLERCCSEMHAMIKEFSNFRHSRTLRDKIIAINTLEEEADALFIHNMRVLHTEETDPIAIIVWRDVYRYIEQ